MSETILQVVLLEDMKTIRIVCLKCFATVEFSVESVRMTQACRFCNSPLTLNPQAGGPINPIGDLATAIMHLRQIERNVRIEFPVHIVGKKPKNVQVAE